MANIIDIYIQNIDNGIAEAINAEDFSFNLELANNELLAIEDNQIRYTCERRIQDNQDNQDNQGMVGDQINIINVHDRNEEEELAFRQQIERLAARVAALDQRQNIPNDLNNQLDHQLDNQLDHQLDDQLDHQLDNQLDHQLDHQLDDQLDHQLDDQLNNR